MFATILSTVVLLVAGEEVELGAWHTSYAQAVKDVQSQDKPLFIVFDTSSSPLGKNVGSEVFLNEEVEKALKADYIRLFVDVESEKGKRLGERFGMDELPRIVVIDRSADWQVYRRSGTHSANEVLAVLAKFRRTKLISTSSSTTIESSGFVPSTSSFGSAILCQT